MQKFALGRDAQAGDTTYGSGAETALNVPPVPPVPPLDPAVQAAMPSHPVAAARPVDAAGVPSAASPAGGGATGTAVVSGVAGAAGAAPPSVTQAQIDASNQANPNAAGANGTPFAGNFTGQGNGAGDGAAALPGGSPDLETDPVYQQQKALDDQLLKDSASGYLSGTKDLLLGYGSSTLGKQVLDGLLADPRIASMFTPADEAAFLANLSDNPDTSTSTLAQLKRKFAGEEKALDEGYNAQNLYYSGARAKGLGDQNYSEQTRTEAVKTALMTALAKLAEGYRGAENQAKQGDLSGYQAAYERALQEALQYGTGAGTDTSSSTSTATTPATTAAPKAPGGAPKAPAAKPAAKAKPNVAQDTVAMALAARAAAVNAAGKKKKSPVYAGRH